MENFKYSAVQFDACELLSKHWLLLSMWTFLCGPSFAETVFPEHFTSLNLFWCSRPIGIIVSKNGKTLVGSGGEVHHPTTTRNFLCFMGRLGSVGA